MALQSPELYFFILKVFKKALEGGTDWSTERKRSCGFSSLLLLNFMSSQSAVTGCFNSSADSARRDYSPSSKEKCGL